MAAKLLYVARREVQAITPPPPPHVPATRATAPPGWRGPTGEDYLVLNAAKGALVPKRRRWDWNKGYCRAVGKQQVEGPGPGDGSSKKHDVSIGDEKKGESDGGDDDDDDAKENRRPRRADGMDDSRKWDTLWWRMRLCNNIYSPKPRFEAGLVFDPGCMRGSWRGKIYVSDHLSYFSRGHDRQCMIISLQPSDWCFTAIPMSALKFNLKPSFLASSRHCKFHTHVSMCTADSIWSAV